MNKLIKMTFAISCLLGLGSSLNNVNNVNNENVEISSSKYGRLNAHLKLGESANPSKTKARKIRKATYPSSYSSVDEGYITSVKNQGNYGTCWAHAAMASSEASLIKNNGYSTSLNLSELHFAYFFYNNAYDEMGLLSGDSTDPGTDGFLDGGGFNYYSMIKLANWTGPIDETKNTAYAYSRASKSFSKPSSEAYSLDMVHLKNAYFADTSDLDAMKEMITRYGAGDFSYYADNDDSHYNSSTGGYYYNGPEYANHEVTVVGWDDNYAVTNFNSRYRPSKPGAWLVKNSWGTSECLNGYFWLSYYDSSVLQDPAAFYEFDTVNNYDHNYQYDGSGNFVSEWSGSRVSTVDYTVSGIQYNGISGGGYEANVFTSQQSEVIQAVSFFTMNEDVNYEVNVYKNVTSTPTTGELQSAATTSGTLTNAGYHTISLNSPVQVASGEKFAVSVKLSGSSNITFMVDYTVSDWGVTNSASSGQSYYSKNGTSWTDASNYGANFRVKAFTTKKNVAVTGIELDKNSTNININDSVKLTPTISPSDATNKNITWSSSASNIASVDQNGNVTGKSEGNALITATTKDGGYTATCTVTVSKVPVNAISLNATNKDININETFQLVATVSPTNATTKDVTWVSNNPNIAEVSSSGLVTGKSVGTTTITATTTDGGHIATCTVNIKAVSVTGVNVPSTMQIKVGKTATITPTITPTNATDRLVTYESSNKRVATIDDSGVITAIKTGVTTITVKTNDGNFTATCEVNVVDGTGNYELITDTDTISAGDKIVIASSSNGAVAGDINSSSVMAKVDQTFTNNNVTIEDLTTSAIEFTVGGSEGAWTLANQDGKLLGATAAKKLAWDSGTTTWSITISSSGATIQSTTSTYGRILYNVGSPRFTTYTSATTTSLTLPTIYRLDSSSNQSFGYEEAITTIATSVATFSNPTERVSNPSDLTSLKAALQNAQDNYNDIGPTEQEKVTNAKYLAAMSNTISFIEQYWYNYARTKVVVSSAARGATEEWTICETLKDTTKTKTVLDAYNALSSETKEVLDDTYDITASDGSTITIGQSIRYMSNSLTLAQNTEATQNTLLNSIRNSNPVIITVVAIASILVISFLTIIVIKVFKKKHQ